MADRFINPAQLGGIESYVINDGPARGARALCVNTGGGLRYRVLVDRGLDIDQAFFNQHSLTFLTHKGVTAPSQGLSRGEDWLKGFPGGLLTSCGPFNIGKPTTDVGEELGLHSEHSNTPATLVTADSDRGEIVIAGIVRYGKFYGGNVELRRVIRSALGKNSIEFIDTFFNAGNAHVPHAWLLHINFGWPLLDDGAEFCYDAQRVEPLADHEPSSRAFAAKRNFKRVPAPSDDFRGEASVIGYIYPRPRDRAGTTVGLANRKLGLGVAIHYSTKEFRRCINWQHFGPGEYVSALEPANGSVEGRDVDRKRGELDSLKPRATKTYRYGLEVVTDDALKDLLRLNKIH